MACAERLERTGFLAPALLEFSRKKEKSKEAKDLRSWCSLLIKSRVMRFCSNPYANEIRKLVTRSRTRADAEGREVHS